MEISEVIQGAWGDLESEKYTDAGVYSRRIFADSKFSIFAVLVRPTGLRQIHFHLAVQENSILPTELRGVTLTKELLREGVVKICLAMSNRSFEEIFSALAADILSKVLTAGGDKKAAEILVSRLAHWQKFMQAAGVEGLTTEQQTGLFGELSILRGLLNASDSSMEIIDSWHGPLADNQDFLMSGCAIEVKATTVNTTDAISISNERQLDDAGLDTLFLCHLSFDVRRGMGTSLPTMVAEIENMLPEEIRTEFEDSLLKVGYLDSQKNKYNARCYVERQRTYYSVLKGFPRIVPGDLMSGVSETSYRLNLSGCHEYIRSEAQVFKEFLNA